MSARYLKLIFFAFFFACHSPGSDAKTRDSSDESELGPHQGTEISEIVSGLDERSAGQTSAQDLQPLIDFLEKKTKYEYKVLVYKEVHDLVAGMREGLIDVGIFTPLAYVQAREVYPSLLPLATATQQSSPTYVGYIVVNRQSSAKTLKDVHGKHMVYVAKDSTSGFLYARSLIKHWGYNPDRYFKDQYFAGTHSSVVEQVANDKELVGAVGQGFVDEGSLLRNPRADQLRVIAKTARIPFDCVASTRRLPQEARAKIRSALIAIDDDPTFSQKLRSHWGYDGFVLSNNQRYDTVAQHQSQ